MMRVRRPLSRGSARTYAMQFQPRQVYYSYSPHSSNRQELAPRPRQTTTGGGLKLACPGSPLTRINLCLFRMRKAPGVAERTPSEGRSPVRD